LPLQPQEFLIYYAAALLVAVVIFLRRRPRKGMLLRLRGSQTKRAEGKTIFEGHEALDGKQEMDKLSHIRAAGERPLNVVFNHNGHSWDAYEVLGLPAGSSPDKVESAYKESLLRVEASSRPFIEAAYKAIQVQWDNYRQAGGA
jgi:hypothetical protein